MDNQFDDELKNRIREVFDNFEDPSADEGWLLLREKFPEKAKRRPVAWLWWSSAAAILLLFLGIWWVNSTPGGKKPTLAVAPKQPVHTLPAQTPAGKKGNVLADSVAITQQSQSIAQNTNHATSPTLKNHGDKNGQQPRAVAEKQNIVASKPSIDTAYISGKLAANSPVKPQMQAAAGNEIIAAAKPNAIQKSDTGNKSSVETLAAVNPPNARSQQPIKPNTLAYADNGASTKKEKLPNDRTIRLGAYATTYVNYARGSNNPLNLGGGVTADIRISKKFRVSTGVSVAQNRLSFSYNNQLQAPSSSAPNYLALAANNVYSTKSAFADAAPALKNYSALLLGLDIPLNLKYVFSPQKSDTYVSAGLSSGTFINEKYNYNYNSPSLLSPGAVQTHALSTKNDFNGFYFAKTLNFSFGTSYNFGGHKVTIEPFVKYPLDGLGSQQLRFGSSGVNLKFNIR